MTRPWWRRCLDGLRAAVRGAPDQAPAPVQTACALCGQLFVWTAGEQQFYAKKRAAAAGALPDVYCLEKEAEGHARPGAGRDALHR